MVLVGAACQENQNVLDQQPKKGKNVFLRCLQNTVEHCTELHADINWSGGINATVYR